MALELYVLTKRTKHMYQVFIEHDEGCYAGALRHRHSFRTDSPRFLNLPGRCALYSGGRSFTWPRQVWTINQAGALCTLLVEFLRAASGRLDHQGFAPCVQAPAPSPGKLTKPNRIATWPPPRPGQFLGKQLGC